MDAFPPSVTRTELDAVRVRRAELRETLSVLEHSLAAPASGRAVVWGEAVHDALVTVLGDLEAHIDVTEGPDGLHRAILAAEPRLSGPVQALTDEHAVISAELGALVAASAPPVGELEIDALRDRATSLLGTLVRHRQRGADLVYEAFQTDIGGLD